MSHITYSVLVPYSVAQMFVLVNDITEYPKFVPGCTISRVIKQNSTELIVEMKVSKGGISKSFTTRNVITKNQSIIMCLVDGPFSIFASSWQFIPFNEEASKIEFYLNFEFKDKLINFAVNHIFRELTNGMVTAFISRAKEVYNARYIS